MMNVYAKKMLNRDARNRALRTFMTGLGVDVTVAVALVLLTFVGPLGGWGEVQWSLLSFSLAKSVTQAGASFVLRRWLDGRIPTPLPPV